MFELIKYSLHKRREGLWAPFHFPSFRLVSNEKIMFSFRFCGDAWHSFVSIFKSLDSDDLTISKEEARVSSKL